MLLHDTDQGLFSVFENEYHRASVHVTIDGVEVTILPETAKLAAETRHNILTEYEVVNKYQLREGDTFPQPTAQPVKKVATRKQQ